MFGQRRGCPFFVPSAAVASGERRALKAPPVFGPRLKDGGEAGAAERPFL